MAHKRGDKLLIAALIFFKLLRFLCLADALMDGVLGSLRGDAAELLGLELYLHKLADHRLFRILCSGVGQNLRFRILHLVDDLLADGDGELIFFRVHDHADIVLGVIVLVDRTDDGGADLLGHVFVRDTLFFFQHPQCLEEFCCFLVCHSVPPKMMI